MLFVIFGDPLFGSITLAGLDHVAAFRRIPPSKSLLDCKPAATRLRSLPTSLRVN